MNINDFFFMTNLHLMCNKSTLKKLVGIEGSTLKDAYQQKYLYETSNPEDKENVKEQDQHFQSIMDMLEHLFNSYSGGGMSIERLKDTLRTKVKNIKPRD
jgi:hypothetical protein